MEPLAPFELELLSRDWILGESGGSFFRRVQENLEFLEEYPEFEKIVVILEENPIDFAAMFFAAVWLGLPIALANPRWGREEQEEFDALMNKGNPERASILIPTGGTTGGVKLAIHDWGSLRAAAEGVCSFLGGAPIDSCCMLPLFHVSGLMQLVRSFVSGGMIRFDDSVVAGYCLSLVPTQLQRALDDEDRIRSLNTAQAIFVGGAKIPDPVIRKARDLRLPIVPVYGMTETAAMVAAVPNEAFLGESSPGAVSIGDSEFSIEPDGRIRIKGMALFKGYFGHPASDLSDGFVVNDEGFLDKEGRLHVIGRVDRLINTGGEKVDPREVEAALLNLENVEEALVVGHPDEEWGQLVLAYVVGHFADEDLDWFRAELRGQLAPYKLPKQVRVVPELPLDARGKYRRDKD